jgi:predicted aspartyl protease
MMNRQTKIWLGGSKCYDPQTCLFTLPVKLSNNGNHSRDANMLFDTGASYTSISQPLARQLAFEATGTEEITFGTGSVPCAVGQIDSLIIRDLKDGDNFILLEKVRVMVLPRTFPLGKFSGVIGGHLLKSLGVVMVNGNLRLYSPPTLNRKDSRP